MQSICGTEKKTGPLYWIFVIFLWAPLLAISVFGIAGSLILGDPRLTAVFIIWFFMPFIIYLFKKERCPICLTDELIEKTKKNTQLSYNRNYNRSKINNKTEHKETSNTIKKQNPSFQEWNSQIYINKGLLEAEKYMDYDVSKLNEMLKQIDDSDPYILEILPQEYINNHNFMNGFINGLANIRNEKELNKISNTQKELRTTI